MPRFPTLVPLLLMLAVLLLAAPVAQSASPNIVVSQVYAGGGNAGATFTHDFVELFNRGSSAVDVSGWTIQYASASGTSWQATPLSGTIQPGRYYLVQLASAAAVGVPLPTPDATGTTNLANSGGKVAVARDATLLTCGGVPGSCSANAQIADLIGWGSAADYEGTGAAAALANATADARAGNGCTDADDNAADFAGATPAPRTSPELGRFAECGGRHRHRPDALDRARACGDQLRQCRGRRHARARHGASDGREQQRGRLRAQRPPLGVRAR